MHPMNRISHHDEPSSALGACSASRSNELDIMFIRLGHQAKCRGGWRRGFEGGRRWWKERAAISRKEERRAYKGLGQGGNARSNSLEIH